MAKTIGTIASNGPLRGKTIGRAKIGRPFLMRFGMARKKERTIKVGIRATVDRAN